MVPVILLATGIALIAGAVDFPGSGVVGWILAVWGGFFTALQLLVVTGVLALLGLAAKEPTSFTVTPRRKRRRDFR